MSVKIGFLGAALSHPRTLGLAFRKTGCAEPVGLWHDPADAQAAAKFCQDVEMPSYDDPEALIEACQAVVVTTQTHEHKRFALKAIERGRPVFIDKPFATSAADAAEVVEAAKRTAVPVMSCSLRRYAPAFQQLAQACRSGEIGQPISAVRFEPHGVKPGDWQDRLETSGGLIFNFGIHCVDCLVDALGDVESVYTQAGRLTFDVQTHDTAVMMLRFASGATGIAEVIGSMHVGPTMATAPSFCVFGSEQSLEAKLSENTLRVYDKGAYGVSPYHAAMGGTEGTARAIAHMASSGEWPIEAQELLMVMMTLEAARRSAEEQRVVAIREIQVDADM